MKLRIVKDGLGMYLVQERIGQWPYVWHTIDAYYHEYEATDSEPNGDGYKGYFQNLSNARDKVKKLLFEHKCKQLKKQLTVVEET